jgi:hypothetical protein
VLMSSASEKAVEARCPYTDVLSEKCTFSVASCITLPLVRLCVCVCVLLLATVISVREGSLTPRGRVSQPWPVGTRSWCVLFS